MKTKSARICPTCQKEHISDTFNCPSCHRKIREDKRKGRPCSCCLKTDVLIYNQASMLCVMCWRRKKIEEDPSYKQKRIDWQRKHDRKKSGRPLDSPLILRPKGSGTLEKGYLILPGYINELGYRVLSNKNHPNASKTSKNRYKVFEHTVVMSAYLGRPLAKHESVHHKNGIRNDNRLENLELWSKKQPAGQRVEDKLQWCKEFLEEYGYTVTKN